MTNRHCQCAKSVQLRAHLESLAKESHDWPNALRLPNLNSSRARKSRVFYSKVQTVYRVNNTWHWPGVCLFNQSASCIMWDNNSLTRDDLQTSQPITSKDFLFLDWFIFKHLVRFVFTCVFVPFQTQSNWASSECASRATKQPERTSDSQKIQRSFVKASPVNKEPSILNKLSNMAPKWLVVSVPVKVDVNT